MWFFPLAAAIVSSVFGALVAQQWLTKGRPQHAAWGAALLMFAIASFAAAIGILDQWTPTWFRIYYLLGAIINVPFLAAGTIYLFGPRPLGHTFIVLVMAGSIFASGAVWAASPELSGLVTTGIPAGSEVWVTDVFPRTLSRYYSFTGFFIVVGGALWSAWRLARRGGEALRSLATANILIAAGTFVVAVASGFARYGRGAVFSVGLLVGVTMMFLGFLRTRPRVETSAASEALTTDDGA